MHSFNDASSASSSINPLVHDIDDAIKELKSNEKWRHEIMTLEMAMMERERLGRKQGISEGREQGIADTTAKYVHRLSQQGLPPETISGYLDLDITEVQKILDEPDPVI